MVGDGTNQGGCGLNGDEDGDAVSDEPEIRYLNVDCQRIVIGTDDILVLSCPDRLEMKEVDWLRAHARRAFNHEKIVVLADGMRLGMVANERAARG